MGFNQSSLGVPSILPQGLTLSLRRASESLLSPAEAPPLIPLSETRMSGSQTTPVVLILPQGRDQGPTTQTAFFEAKGPLVPHQGPQLVAPKTWNSPLCPPEALPPIAGPQSL